MNTQQLQCMLRAQDVSRTFKVLAADQLPRIIQHYPLGYIVNTEDSHLPGKHWIAFWFESPMYGEFFDSFGNGPSFYRKEFKEIFRLSVRNYIYNDVVLQSSDSNTCGLYTMLYIILKTNGYSMKNIQHLFTKDKRWNDQLMYDFVHQHFNHCI